MLHRIYHLVESLSSSDIWLDRWFPSWKERLLDFCEVFSSQLLDTSSRKILSQNTFRADWELLIYLQQDQVFEILLTSTNLIYRDTEKSNYSTLWFFLAEDKWNSGTQLQKCNFSIFRCTSQEIQWFERGFWFPVTWILAQLKLTALRLELFQSFSSSITFLEVIICVDSQQ